MVSTAQTLCSQGVVAAVAYGAITALDCSSANFSAAGCGAGAAVGGVVGGVAGPGGSIAGGILGCFVGAKAADAAIDTAAFALQNYLSQNTACPVSQVSSCADLLS